VIQTHLGAVRSAADNFLEGTLLLHSVSLSLSSLLRSSFFHLYLPSPIANSSPGVRASSGAEAMLYRVPSSRGDMDVPAAVADLPVAVIDQARMPPLHPSASLELIPLGTSLFLSFPLPCC
jgi:hypothetical protein